MHKASQIIEKFCPSHLEFSNKRALKLIMDLQTNKVAGLTLLKFYKFSLNSNNLIEKVATQWHYYCFWI